MSGKKILNAISVDIEDWYHGILQISYKDWPKCENRLEKSLTRVLQLFNTYSVKATFFVLGCIAEKYPEIVNMILREGHEIASHGYHHQLVYVQNRKEFYEDVLRSKQILESITNTKVIGYRAPFFLLPKILFGLWTY